MHNKYNILIGIDICAILKMTLSDFEGHFAYYTLFKMQFFVYLCSI